MDEHGGERRGDDQIPENVPEQIAYAEVHAMDHIADVARDSEYGYSDQCSCAYFCVEVDLTHVHAIFPPYRRMTDIAPQIRANRRELRDLKIAVLTPDTNNSIMKIKTDAANAPQKNGVKLMLFLLCFGLF